MIEFEGIVIRTTPFREHDLVVNVLSNDKMRSFLARGALKMDSKNASSVNNYAHSRFAITKGKDGFSLRSGELLDSYEHIKEDLSRLAVLDFIGEITNKLVQSDDAPYLYGYLEKSLQLLNSGFDPYTVAIIYFAKVLNVAGYGLEVDSCVFCGQKSQIVAINYMDGGFICEDCFDSLNHAKSSPRKLKILRYIFKVDKERFGQVSFEKEECLELLNELASFCHEVTQVEIKSLSLIRKA